MTGPAPVGAGDQSSKARVGLARRVSAWLAAIAALTAALGFFFWEVFREDAPMIVGNMRGTALTILVVAIPVLAGAMVLSARGSLRARFVWLGCLAYLAYNAVLFCFATHFNALFLLFTAMLALAFWALVTFLRALDLDLVRTSSAAVPARGIAAYLVICTANFALLWLLVIVPATLTNTTPAGLAEMGLPQNPVWVLDFAFTFPLMVLGSLWLWQRRVWGVVIGGMMTVMLAIETAGIAADQAFGRLHDPSASVDTVPVLIGFTVAGLIASALFLRGIRTPPAV